MKKVKGRKFLHEEKGNALVLATLSLMVLLTIAGAAIDGGMLFMTKSHLQKSVNAAVLSGAQELTYDQEKISQVVDEVLLLHDSNIQKEILSVIPEKELRVGVNKPVKLAFSSLLGIETVNVYAEAAAELGTLGKAVGIVPLGIDENVNLVYGKKYSLKVDSKGVEYGNFGILALGGPGADRYEENFRYGYQEEVKIGDIFETQTGNIAGKTKKVVQERVNGCAENMNKVTAKNCSRVVLIPVYSEHNRRSNQLKEVMVKGFAYFYITDPFNSKDTSVSGKFIKLAGPGSADESAVDKGAYNIRLTK
ncbi:Tad domain-containing protein [Halobacillus yeomjeoni]|uniref:TadE/TadG family type IV pilus assembly protein n=1 Tax=Halobacillus yeomjeoni TaxID=311194 RepID=UPI001CD1FECC|nr:Tad domain-containing protein [Halobacillus yeomjeoni]MCA0983415.1 Tad domain-containing protein [Halobacillus yeomjeoni]